MYQKGLYFHYKALILSYIDVKQNNMLTKPCKLRLNIHLFYQA